MPYGFVVRVFFILRKIRKTVPKQLLILLTVRKSFKQFALIPNNNTLLWIQDRIKSVS